MSYPIWNIPHLGGALVIAGIAIVHVMIAHFAVGAGIFNILTEARARRQNDPILLQFVRDNSKFLIYFSFVSGAVTGVGIWFSIGLVAPEGTSYLIRLFLWAWAIEWIFFLIELTSGYIYYFTWDRLSPAQHLIVGWIYAISAFLSLVVINGILTFMLTPGIWPISGNFWDAWLNPSALPSLCLRTVSALSFAGIFVAIVVLRTQHYTDMEREKIIKWGARFLLPLALMPFFAVWYFLQVPVAARNLVLGGSIAMSFIFIFGVIASILVTAFAFFGMLRKPRDFNFESAFLLCALAFIATASMEFNREGIRKPYLITNIMYSNGIMVNDVQRLNEQGVLSNSVWIKPDTMRYQKDIAVGEAIFRIECLRCHQITGYNGIIPLIRDWNRDLIFTALNNLDQIKPYMPPFIGTEEEKKSLAAYLISLSPRSQIVPLQDSVSTPTPEDSVEVVTP